MSGRDEPLDLGRRYDHAVIEDTPSWVIDQIMATFRERHLVPQRTSLTRALIRRISAAVTFDDWATGPALAVRGAAAPPDGSRHLVFAVESGSDGVATLEVAISLYPISSGAVSVVGQVLDGRPNGTVHLVEAMQGDDVVAAVTTTPSGEFCFDVPHTWTELVVVGDVGEVSIPAAPYAGRSAPA